MKARLLESANVLKLVDLLRGQGYEVFAPFAGRGRWAPIGRMSRQPR